MLIPKTSDWSMIAGAPFCVAVPSKPKPYTRSVVRPKRPWVMSLVSAMEFVNDGDALPVQEELEYLTPGSVLCM